LIDPAYNFVAVMYSVMYALFGLSQTLGNFLKRICAELLTTKHIKGTNPAPWFYRIIKNLFNLCESFVIFVLNPFATHPHVVQFRLSQTHSSCFLGRISLINLCSSVVNVLQRTLNPVVPHHPFHGSLDPLFRRILRIVLQVSHGLGEVHGLDLGREGLSFLVGDQGIVSSHRL